MNILGFMALVVTGFTACAEFGSYAFVHPVLRHLPREYHLQVEQGLLRTFGRVMPILMTLCVVLSVSYAVHDAPSRQSDALGGLGGNGFVRRGSGLHHYLQRSHQRRHWPIGCRQSAAGLEEDAQPMGVLSGSPVLASPSRIRPAMFGRHDALTPCNPSDLTRRCS